MIANIVQQFPAMVDFWDNFFAILLALLKWHWQVISLGRSLGTDPRVCPP